MFKNIKLLPFHIWWMPDSTDHSRNAKFTFVFSTLENDCAENIVAQDQEFWMTDAGK
jgi:hypothetical protein